MAFRLHHPGRLLRVLSLASGSAGGEASQPMLGGLVAHMGPEDLKLALEYVREWNTNSKHCHAAQAMLRAVLKHFKPKTLLEVPGGGWGV